MRKSDQAIDGDEEGAECMNAEGDGYGGCYMRMLICDDVECEFVAEGTRLSNAK